MRALFNWMEAKKFHIKILSMVSVVVGSNKHHMCEQRIQSNARKYAPRTYTLCTWYTHRLSHHKKWFQRPYSTGYMRLVCVSVYLTSCSCITKAHKRNKINIQTYRITAIIHFEPLNVFRFYGSGMTTSKRDDEYKL